MAKQSKEGAVPSFPTVDSLREGLDAKAQFKPVDLYPRDGSEQLGRIEETIAHLAHVSTGNALAYGSGMAAATSAIEVGLVSISDRTPVLAQAEELYSQTQRYTKFWHEDSRRTRVRRFKSNDANKLEENFSKADVVVLETIGNYLNVPVVDTENLLRLVREHPEVTTIIDNTFPLSTSMPFGELITDEDRVIVVESGTKAYTFNEDTLGVTYTKHPELFDKLQRHRRTVGSLLGVKSLELIEGLIPANRENFNVRNRKIFNNTLILAKHLQEALESARLATDRENDALDIFGTTINHPGLATHDDHELYTRDFPWGGVPAFYIFSQDFDQYELTERLWAHPAVREQADLGQSFGFNRTRIVADESAKAVRIAGGAMTDAESLGKALAEALVNSQR